MRRNADDVLVFLNDRGRGGSQPFYAARRAKGVKGRFLGLCVAVPGELLGQGIVAVEESGDMDVDVGGDHAPGLGMAERLAQFGGVEQCLGGHASPQDAKPAQFGGAVNDSNLPSPGGEGAGSGESGGTAADDGGVKVHGGHTGNVNAPDRDGNPEVVTV